MATEELVVWVADEVQTGFGRCGSKFWGFETQAGIPPMMILTAYPYFRLRQYIFLATCLFLEWNDASDSVGRRTSDILVRDL